MFDSADMWERPGQVLAIALVVITSVYLGKRFMLRRRWNLPPGPRGLPFIGNAITVMRSKMSLMVLTTSWAKEYGDIVYFRFGSTHFFSLNSYDAMREAFQNPILNGRMATKLRNKATGLRNHGVALSIGKTWREQRQFVHSVFRSLGVGKRSYEDTIAGEVSRVSAAIEHGEGKGGRPFDPNDLFCCSVSNLICTLVFGTQFDYSDAEFRTILHYVNRRFELMEGGSGVASASIPGIHLLPFGPVKELLDVLSALHNFIADKINSHQLTFDPEQPRDFIDIYLQKMAEVEGTESSFNPSNLAATVHDLFIAGTETTSTSLKWLVLFMMAHPEVQSRVQDELDHVVGRDRLPSLADRRSLPYTNAVILESQRKARTAPGTVPHVALEETALCGYTIPKGSILLGNIWHVLSDERYWDEPDVFRPERFLSPEGTLVKRDDLIIFSTGRRMCPGEQLARMEMFLFFTSLLHRFTFKMPDDSPPIPLEGVFTGTHNTGPYKTCAFKRL